MTLLFMDGFDHYNDTIELTKKWTAQTSTAIMTTGSRFGTGYHLLCPNSACFAKKFFVSEPQTVVVGSAFKTDVLNGGTIFNLEDTGTVQIILSENSNGELEIYRGWYTTLLETSVQTISQGVWYYIELKATIDNSAGAYEVRVNGETWLQDSGVDTQTSANAYMDYLSIYCAGNFKNHRFDDIYVLDTNGTENNDFLGDVRVETIRPAGAGNETDWTPSTGANWENVDDVHPDDDSTYNYVGSGAGFPQNDLYTLDNLTTTLGEIYAVQINSYTRKDDAGSVGLANILRTGGTTYSGIGIESMGDTYDFQSDIVEKNPDTSSQWTVAEINSLETGIRRVS